MPPIMTVPPSGTVTVERIFWMTTTGSSIWIDVLPFASVTGAGSRDDGLVASVGLTSSVTYFLSYLTVGMTSRIEPVLRLPTIGFKTGMTPVWFVSTPWM